MTPRFLLFEYSEGTDGTGLFEAMAAVLPAQAAAVQAEIDAVLDWAAAQFAARAPVEDGGDWDAALQVGDEADGTGALRRVFSLSVAGSAAFCAAFRDRFRDAVD